MQVYTVLVGLRGLTEEEKGRRKTEKRESLQGIFEETKPNGTAEAGAGLFWGWRGCSPHTTNDHIAFIFPDYMHCFPSHSNCFECEFNYQHLCDPIHIAHKGFLYIVK